MKWLLVDKLDRRNYAANSNGTKDLQDVQIMTYLPHLYLYLTKTPVFAHFDQENLNTDFGVKRENFE